MSLTTLVTGATGFVGTHLLQRLNGRRPIVGWHRPGTQPVATQVSWDAVDLEDRHSVFSGIERRLPGAIFHLAGAANVASSWAEVLRHLRTNTLGVHYLLEAVRSTGVRSRILVVSSGQIYQASSDPLDESAALVPATPYGFSKLAEDQLALRAAREDGLDVIVARPFNHIGPGQAPGYAVSSFARQIARIEAGIEPPELRVGNLDARRDVTDVRDVVAAYDVLMERGRSGAAYNVCSGQVWRVGDLLERLLDLSNVPVRVVTAAAHLRPSDAPTFHGSAEKIQRELGWTPSIPITQTLRDTLDWWRARVAAGTA